MKIEKKKMPSQRVHRVLLHVHIGGTDERFNLSYTNQIH